MPDCPVHGEVKGRVCLPCASQKFLLAPEQFRAELIALCAELSCTPVGTVHDILRHAAQPTADELIDALLRDIVFATAETGAFLRRLYRARGDIWDDSGLTKIKLAIEKHIKEGI